MEARSGFMHGLLNKYPCSCLICMGLLAVTMDLGQEMKNKTDARGEIKGRMFQKKITQGSEKSLFEMIPSGLKRKDGG